MSGVVGSALTSVVVAVTVLTAVGDAQLSQLTRVRSCFPRAIASVINVRCGSCYSVVWPLGLSRDRKDVIFVQRLAMARLNSVTCDKYALDEQKNEHKMIALKQVWSVDEAMV